MRRGYARLVVPRALLLAVGIASGYHPRASPAAISAEFSLDRRRGQFLHARGILTRRPGQAAERHDAEHRII